MRFLTRAKKPDRKAAKAPAAGAKKRARPARKASADPTARRRALKYGGFGGLGLAVAGALVAAVVTGAPQKAADWAQDTALTASAEMGLAVGEVYVIGRRETAKEDLVAALGLNVGDPILGFDPAEARIRIEKLGWVKSASVHRHLPATVTLQIDERKAIAIWQHEDRFVLIDPDGIEIGRKDVHRHGHLKVVVGPDAPQHAAELLDILATEPELEERVLAAQRVGARRWNLRLEGGIDVSLPEDGAEIAWRRLAEFQRDHEILSRAVGEIDMRHPDRLTLELTEPGLQEVLGRRNAGEET